MIKFSKISILRVIGLGTVSITWIYVTIQVLLGTLSFPAFGFFT